MNLLDPIERLPNTSVLTIRQLKSLEINNFSDLLNYFPFRYENYSLISPIAKIQEGELVTVKGKITKVENIFTKKGTKIQKVKLVDNTGSVDITWYNQLYLMRLFKKDNCLSICGEVVRFGPSITIQPAQYELLKSPADQTIHTGRIVPVYPETRGLSSKTIRSKIYYIVKNLENLKEIYPSEILKFNDLIDLTLAYKQIHFPDNLKIVNKARERLAFDELFGIQLSAAYVRMDWNKENVAHQFILTPSNEIKLHQLVNNLPFKLTNSQLKCVKEILEDLKQTKPMNRFLEGEVGSGKTVVAAVACYFCYLNGFQSLFMAPTEILAQQHYRTIQELFNYTSEVECILVTGSSKPDKKRLGRANIIIGTHALIQKDLSFEKVGLVIVDEQHRFGVRQRAMLKEKAVNPHLLTMTATPIPRTVLLTLYGELDISIIDEMPVGRIPIRTFLVPKEKRQSGYHWIKDQIKKNGSQIFIICPLIEESDVETMQSLKAAKKEYEYLSKEVYPDLRVALLHGKLKSKEKETIMKDFKDKKYDILVSTSVVEVGIDISNATIILIEGAERFGLAQLHQLRGRVGRGDRQSYCLLFTEAFDQSTIERLQFFSRTQSGIKLAEYDLKTRGPGDIYGTKQHGFMNLKVASLSDVALINKSKASVGYFIKKYPNLNMFPEIKKQLDEIRVKQISRD
jgi:ATP-dependent DNA helicase RecG